MVLNEFEQAVSASSGLLLKPAHMLISALVVRALRKAPSFPARVIRLAFILFLAGEAACAANFIIANHGLLPLDIMHDAGMIAFGAVLSMGLFLLADERIVRLTPPSVSCLLLKSCHTCWKGGTGTCRLKTLALLAAAGGAVLAAAPLAAPLTPVAESGMVFGSPVSFGLAPAMQFLAYRVYPLAAIACFLAAFILISRQRGISRQAMALFFAGTGFFLYGALRLALTEIFRTVPFWSDFWEEATELLVAGGTAILIASFKDHVFAGSGPADRPSDQP